MNRLPLRLAPNVAGLLHRLLFLEEEEDLLPLEEEEGLGRDDDRHRQEGVKE